MPLNISTTANESHCSYVSPLSNNKSLCNLETDIESGIDNRLSVRLNLFVSCEQLISMGCTLVALIIILRCRKMPISIRYLSANFLISFLMIGFSTLVHNIALIILGTDSPFYAVLFNTRLLFFCVFLLVLWWSMCAITAERFIAIVYPFRYVPLMRKSIVCVTITLIWALNIIVPSALVLSNLLTHCGSHQSMSVCDAFVVLTPFRLYVSSALCMSFIITISLYSRILLSLRDANMESYTLGMINPTDNSKTKHPTTTASSAITNTILIIILTFLFLQAPYLIIILIKELIPVTQDYKWRIVFQVVGYICHELNIIVTLFNYIWKFPECRLNFYQMFSRMSRRFEAKAESLRLEVYNIVTFDRKETDTSV